ncbi:MAG TPA: MgtC/SapB family protein [Actinomycetota bacterium]
MIDDGTVALRLVLAAVAGGILGLERELRDRPAGLRTHILVATGAALFAMVSAYGFQDIVAEAGPLSSGQGAAVRADITRVASQVVVGVGFLGAGTIIRYRGRVRGLTTAAGLWVAAAAGLAAGIGFWVGVGVSVGIALLSLLVLKPIEDRLIRKQREEPWGRESHHDTGAPEGPEGDEPG